MLDTENPKGLTVHEYFRLHNSLTTYMIETLLNKNDELNKELIDLETSYEKQSKILESILDTLSELLITHSDWFDRTIGD